MNQRLSDTILAVLSHTYSSNRQSLYWWHFGKKTMTKACKKNHILTFHQNQISLSLHLPLRTTRVLIGYPQQISVHSPRLTLLEIMKKMFLKTNKNIFENYLLCIFNLPGIRNLKSVIHRQNPTVHYILRQKL